MNNYLMFGHILKVRLMPQEQVHPDIWKGANKRFKVVPRAMLEKREMERAKGRGEWEKKVGREMGKRERKRKEMEGLGYEFKAPELRKVGDVPMKNTEPEGEPVAEAATEGKGEAQANTEDAIKSIAETAIEGDEVQVEVEKVIKQGKKVKEEKTKVKVTKKVNA